MADRHAAGRTATVRWLALLAVLSLLPMATTLTSSLAVTMALLVLAMFLAAGFILFGLRYGGEAYPAARASLVAGIGAGSWSALVAGVMPLLGRLLDQSRYGEAFALVSLAPLLGFAGWWSLTRRAVRP